MKREIKFRAWDKQNKKIVDSFIEFVKNNGNNVMSETVVERNYPDGAFDIGDVMQYTGLKDKNGKEIFEGDILVFGNNNPIEVSFDNGCFNVFEEPLGWNFDEVEDFNPIKTDFKYCEIIGNIHENPELLNK